MFFDDLSFDLSSVSSQAAYQIVPWPIQYPLQVTSWIFPSLFKILTTIRTWFTLDCTTIIIFNRTLLNSAELLELFPYKPIPRRYPALSIILLVHSRLSGPLPTPSKMLPRSWQSVNNSEFSLNNRLHLHQKYKNRSLDRSPIRNLVSQSSNPLIHSCVSLDDETFS